MLLNMMIVVLAGGLSPERNVSLSSGAMVCQALRDRGHQVALVDLFFGLDDWDKEPEVQKAQRYWFRRQMELARETNLPVIIHSRDAAADTMEVMKSVHAEEIPGVIHCYSYSKEMAQEFIKMGYYIGVGGVVTFKNAKKLKETVQEIPLERILLETDCPYMAPEPHRGERNDSSYIPFVIEKIAELRGITPEEVEQATRVNAEKLFRIM